MDEAFQNSADPGGSREPPADPTDPLDTIGGGMLGRTEVFLLEWQSTGCHRRLEMLLQTALPLLQACIAKTLRMRGISDESAIDDAISLVLDHLRRLPGTQADGTAVARFSSAPVGRRRPAGGDPGTAYLHWLARERAADVARARRRHFRREVPFSILDDRSTRLVETNPARDGDSRGAGTRGTDEAERLQAIVPALEPRLRTVVEMLLRGMNQTTIAQTLGVCEGTVSRLRAQAIAELRRLMQE